MRSSASPLVSMLGLPAAGRDRRAQRRQRARLLGAQRPLRHGARSHRRPARARRAGRGDRALGRRICSRVEVDGRAADRGERRQPHLVCRARCARAPRSATRSGTARNSTTRRAARIVGLYRLTFRDPAAGAGQGQGRAHLSDHGDDAGRDAAHEAAEPRDRPADQASGGRVVSAAPLAQISVGVVVERRKAASPWIDFTWRPVTVLPGAPAAAPWTQLSADGDVATFYAGAADIALYRTETTNYRDNLATGAPSLWVALRPTGVEPPYRPHRGDRRSGRRRRPIPQNGDDLVEAVPMPEPMRAVVEAFVAEHHVERPFVQAQARPRRSGSAGAARADAEGSSAMSDPENFLTRWSRRKREADESVRRRATSATQSKAEARPDERAADAVPPQPAPAANVETDGTGVRSRAACRRSNRSRPRPTSAPSSRPACRPICRLRRFAARGPPIPRSGISSGLPTTTGTSIRRARSRASGRWR